MKNKQSIIGLFLISIILLFNEDIKKSKYFRTQPTQIELIVESDTACYDEVELILPTNFNIVYTSFKSYNPYIDTVSAAKFTEVANHFGLTNDLVTLKWSIGQILLESGAKQFYQPTHPKEGELLVSSAGAIGFTQILPSTALGYMVKKLSGDDKECFIELGASDFEFAYSDECNKSEKVIMAKEWLTDETNNMIMWGKIMNDGLEHKPLIDALIAYNAGSLGLTRYLNAGNEQEDHDYIILIKARLKYVDA